MVGIRADANNAIALGHVMRCISIALEIRQMGHMVVFLVSDSYACPFFDEYGLDYHVLNTDWKDKNSEIDVLKEIIDKLNIDSLLIDSYEITNEYFNSLRECVRLVYLDDLCKEPYNTDILINYSREDADSRYEQLYEKCAYKPVWFTGLKYTPLKKEFELCAEAYIQKEQVTDIVITTGGTDSAYITYNVANALKEYIYNKNIAIHIIAGPFFEEELVRRLDELAGSSECIKVHKKVSNIADIVSRCQIAVSAGGTTLLEICAIGAACIGIPLNDSQMPLIRYLDRRGAICTGRCDDYEGIADSVIKLADSQDIRKRLSADARELNDAKGAKRIADILVNWR